MKDKEKKQNEEQEKNGDKKEGLGNEKAKLKDQEELNQKDDIQSKIELLELELTAYKDKFLRKAAEFENYKRRTENDQLNLIKYGAEGFIRRILPVIDDFERSLSHIETASEVVPIKEGIKLVYDKFMKILNEHGVQKIKAVGKPFDVHYHEALLQKKAENVKPHTVIEELETGYTYNEKVIRHSKVVVSDDSENDEGKGQEDSDNLNTGENG